MGFISTPQLKSPPVSQCKTCIRPFNKGQVVTPCITTKRGPSSGIHHVFFEVCVRNPFQVVWPEDFAKLHYHSHRLDFPKPKFLVSVCVAKKNGQTSPKKNNNSKNGSRRFGGASCFFHVESGSVVVFLYRKKSWVTSMVFVKPKFSRLMFSVFWANRCVKKWILWVE